MISKHIERLMLMKVLITIDVEAHRGLNPVDSFIWGRSSDGNYHGLKEIVDYLKSKRLVGVFFVDFAEFFDYQEREIEDVIAYLKNENQYIGLHLHPDHMGNKEKTFLWEYSYDEQNEMIRKCIQKFVSYVGYYPIMFRAGKFGADDRTIKALANNGILLDLSSYYHHSWCKITNQPYSNAPYSLNCKVKEIPVSVFRSMDLPNGKSLRYDQIDLGVTHKEFISAINNQKCIEDGAIITAFFHSFSFFPDRRNPERLKYSPKCKDTFMKNIEFILNSDIHVINPFCFDWKELQVLKNTDCKSIPSSGSFAKQLFYTFKRAFGIRKSNKRARLLVTMCEIIISLFMLMIIIEVLF